MKHKIKTLTKTCDSCPAQWEGKTYEDKFVYVRYRFGCLQLSVADSEYYAVMGTESPVTFCSSTPSTVYLDVGDEMDGSMELTELIHYSQEFFDFSSCEYSDSLDNFYLYTVPTEKLKEYSPARELDSVNPLRVGKEVEPIPGAQELTADKKKFIVDPNRKKIDLKKFLSTGEL